MIQSNAVSLVAFYKLPGGKCPYIEWSSSLPSVLRARIDAHIERTRLGGGKNNIKALGDGIFEIRIHAGAGYRVYFAQTNSGNMLILNAGSKSTQGRDIKKAKLYWRNRRA